MRQRIMTCLIIFIMISTGTVRAQFAGISAESELRVLGSNHRLYPYSDHGILAHIVFGKYHPGITAGIKWEHFVETHSFPTQPSPTPTIDKTRRVENGLLFPLYFDYGARSTGPTFSCRTQLGLEYRMPLSSVLESSGGAYSWKDHWRRTDARADRIELLARAGLQWNINKRFQLYTMAGYYRDVLAIKKISFVHDPVEGFSFSLTFHYATKKG